MLRWWGRQVIWLSLWKERKQGPRGSIWKEDEEVGALGMGTRAACVEGWLCLVPLLFPSSPEVLIRQVQGASLIPHMSPGAVLGTPHP